MNYPVRVAIVVVGLALPWVLSPVGAQNCQDMPPGPAKKQCVKQNHPEFFEKKKENCKELAQQRDSYGKGGGQKDFMQSCMRGKVGQ
jgi:hypothetical protein